MLRALATSKAIGSDALNGHCEVAERFGARLGFGPRIVRNLGQLYARWDGQGIPLVLKGEAISPAVRVVTLAQDAITLDDAYGLERCVRLVRKRRAAVYDPRMVDCFAARAEAFMSSLAGRTSWQAVRKLEPAPHGRLSGADIDEMLLLLPISSTSNHPSRQAIRARSPSLPRRQHGNSDFRQATRCNCGVPASSTISVRPAFPRRSL